MLKFWKKTNKETLPEKPTQTEKSGLVSSLARGLKRTREILLTDVTDLFSGRRKIDQALLEELEIRLLTADVGVTTTQKILQNVTTKLKGKVDGALLLETVKEELEAILIPCSQNLIIPNEIQPFVILLVGVNGSGKTTTIGKLAQKLQIEGKKVMLGAGDTFRAAAIDQLKIWGERNSIPVIAQKPGSDSAAVLFDALQSARAHKVDVLIADTAGRLHTQNNLMEELKKIKRTMQKIDPQVPHEILLVLDATIGQNALNQAREFNTAVGITGICITKLDGTAKGGIIFAIAEALHLPIRFVGVGETIDDLKPFIAHDFVEALFDEKK